MGIKGYKAFGKGLICNPDGVAKQYKEHTTFEEDGDVNLGPCRKGVMHFCEDPFDILGRYPLFNSDGEITEIAEVEAVGDVRNYGNQSITNKLHIGAKLNLKGFVKACVDFTIEKTKFEIDKDSDSDISSGDYAQIGSSGDSAKITSEGRDSVVMAAGFGSMAKAKIGSWITLAEWGRVNNADKNIWKPKCVKTEYVDGEKIKEDTFYKLIDGEFKEVKEND